VVRLEAQLFLQPRQLGQRLLQMTVLERHGRLVREGLEQAQVVVHERRPLGQPIGDPKGADECRFTAERADHVGLAAGTAVGRRQEERGRGRDDHVVDGVRPDVLDRDHDVGLAFVA
jgi:hypothetical protein